MINMYVGTIGSGKSYHALEDIIAQLRKGKYVIANFPLNFSEGMIRKGYHERFMYIPDDLLMGEDGMKFLFAVQKKMQFYQQFGEGACLCVIDEAGNHYPPEDNAKKEQRQWKMFFTQSRKMGYDFTLVCQEEGQINRTIKKCAEYIIYHRKANNMFPFSLMPFTLFMFVTFWNGRTKQRLKSASTIFVKKFAELYNTDRMFGNIDEQFEIDLKGYELPPGFSLEFGNSHDETAAVSDKDDGKGGTPWGGSLVGTFQKRLPVPNKLKQVGGKLNGLIFEEVSKSENKD